MLSTGVDARRLVYASNVALVAVLSLAGAFLINLNDTYWALLTVPFVVQMDSGNTIWRSVTRVTGTVLGGIVAVAVISLLPQDGLATIAALSLWALATGALTRFEFGLDAYAYAVAGFTVLVIVFDTGPSATQAYPIALARVTEIVIPAAAACMIPLVLFPAPVRYRLRKEIAAAENRILSLAWQVASNSNDAPTTEWMEIVRALAAIYSDLRASRLESLLATPLDEDAVLANDLDHLLVATKALSLALSGLGDDSSFEVVAQSRRDLAQILSPAATDEKGARPHAGRMAELIARLEARTSFRLGGDAAESATGHDLAALVAIHQVAVAARSFCQDAKPDVDRSGAAARKIVLGARYRDWVAALQRGARPAIVVSILSLLWFWTASAQFQAVAVLSGALALALPAIAPRAQVKAAGFGIGIGIIAMFLPALALEALLPLVQGYAAYAALISSVLFVLAYIASYQGRFVYLFGGVIFLAEALQPSNISIYSGINLINTTVVLLFIPISVAVTFNVIFPETIHWLRWRLNQGVTRLLRQASTNNEDEPTVLLRQALDLVGDYGGDLDAKDPSNEACLNRCGAVMAAVAVLQILNRMQRRDELPAQIARTLPDVREAVLNDVQRRGPAHTRSNLRMLADVLATAQAHIVENVDGSVEATVRFAGWVQFLRILVEQRRLAPAE